MTLNISSKIKLAVKGEGRESTLIRIGDAVIGGGKVAVIAGPCTVESREQMIEAASAVKAAGASMLRGGAFKPRTLPYSFQGQMRMDEITGGSPYGASTIAGGQGERMPSENELAAARFQGKHVATIASKLARG